LSQSISIYVGENQTYNENVSICSGSDFTFPDGTVATAVTSEMVHVSNLTSAAGCDSIIETTLTINPVFNLTETAAVCTGSDYTFPDGTTLTNITTQQVHVSSLQTIAGCDSIIETTVNVNPIFNSTEEVTICEGESYTFPDGSVQTNITAPLSHTSEFLTVNGCDSNIVTSILVNPTYSIVQTVELCEGASYIFPDGTELASIIENTVYTSNLQTANGCDSIITTTLIMNNVYQSTVLVSLCSGSDYTFPDATTQTNISADLTYISSFQSIAGCDSIITTVITVNTIYNLTESVTVCNGSSYTFPDGTIQTGISADMVYTSSLQTLLGCDSILVTNLTVVDAYYSDDNVSVCKGSSYTFPNGNTVVINEETSQTFTYTSVAGCDSIVTTTVTPILPVLSSENVTVCYGSTFTFADGSTELITAAISRETTILAANGCDSIITTNIQLFPNANYTANQTVSICTGGSVTFPNGEVINNIVSPFTQTSIFQNMNGCDSTIFTSVELYQQYTSSVTTSICAGSSYTFPDGSTQSNLTSQVVQSSTLQSMFGCDSTIITTVNISFGETYNQDVAICNGSSYTFPDGSIQSNITTQVIYTSTLVGALGCDSIIVTTVTPQNSLTFNEDVTICAGSSYTFPDGSTQSGITSQIVYTSNLQTISGCDSIIVTTVNVISLNPNISLDGDVLSANQIDASYQWVDCSTNNPITGATNATFIPTVSGSYACIIQSETCSVTSECVEVTLVGLENLSNTHFMIYPNPVLDIINIETDSKVIDVKIFSATGSLVQIEKSNEFSVENLVKGVYFINITTEKGMIKTKFIKA
jgi:hypothetical protein